MLNDYHCNLYVFLLNIIKLNNNRNKLYFLFIFQNSLFNLAIKFTSKKENNFITNLNSNV